MKTNPPDKSFWIVAVNEEQLEGMNHHQYKLNLQNVHSLIKLLNNKSLTLFIYDNYIQASFKLMIILNNINMKLLSTKYILPKNVTAHIFPAVNITRCCNIFHYVSCSTPPSY